MNGTKEGQGSRHWAKPGCVGLEGFKARAGTLYHKSLCWGARPLLSHTVTASDARPWERLEMPREHSEMRPEERGSEETASPYLVMCLPEPRGCC